LLPLRDALNVVRGAGGASWDPKDFNASGRAVECKPKPPLLSAYKPRPSPASPVLECALESDLPTGPVEVLVAVAYTYLRLSEWGVVPFATCACGFFSDALYGGGKCLPCPRGASCRGGGDPPRAIAGAWKTDVAQWAARGIAVSLNETSEEVAWAPPKAAFPLFVPCALEGRCLPDGACTSGSAPVSAAGLGPWMCLPCDEGWVTGDNETCVYCSPEQVDTAKKVVGGGALVLAILGALLYFYVVKPRREAHRKRLAALKAEGKAEDEVEAMVPPTRPVFAYIKIMLSYAQTLGALSLYTRSSLTSEQRTSPLSKIPIAVLLPAVLDKFRLVVDFGVSTAGFRCLFGLKYEEGKRNIMWLPLAALSAGYGGTFVGLVGANAFFWALAARRRSPASAHRTPKTLFQRWYKQVKLPEWRKTAAYVALLCIFFALPVATTQLVATQACAPREAGGYVREAPEISCFDNEYITRVKGPARVLAWVYILIPLLGGYALMKNYEWTMDSLTFLTDVRLQAALSRSRPRANERDELSFARTGPLILCAQLSHPSYPPRHR
jgi:hypothetical protein